MQFLERKKEDKYIYETEGDFGKIEIEAPYKLRAPMVDAVFMEIIGMKHNEKHVDGTIKLPQDKGWKGGFAKFTFEKKGLDGWSEIISEEDKEWISEIAGIKFNDLLQTELDLIANKYAENGYRRSQQLQDYLIKLFKND